MRPPASALIACLALLLLAASTAAAQGAGIWERPRNALSLPVQEPTSVEIYLSQTQLYAMRGDTSMMPGGGALGGAVTGYMMYRNEKLADPKNAFLTQLNASIPAADYRSVLTAAVRRQLDGTRLANITRVDFHTGTSAETESARPGNPDEQVLALDVRYYLAPHYNTLRVAMTARLGPRRIVTAPPVKARPPLFVQELYADTPTDRRDALRKDSNHNAAYWTRLGGSAVGANIVSGMDEVMAMLAAELTRQPRFGRITGKQVAWEELNDNRSYGVLEQQVGGRDWLRLRNGRLASLPTPAP